MLRRLKKRPLWFVATVIAGVAVLAFLAIPVSVMDSEIEVFEMQVVLGGNSRERSEISAALWREQPTPIIVSGDGGWIRDHLIALEIPEGEIIHEVEARTTWENASHSVKIMREQEVKSAVIVTSAFHSARALACFRKLAPGVQFGTRTKPGQERVGWDAFQLRIRERCSRLAYWMAHGLNPWSLGR